MRVHLDLHVSRSVHTLFLIRSAALCVFGVLSSALGSSVRERSQRRETGPMRMHLHTVLSCIIGHVSEHVLYSPVTGENVRSP